MPSTKQLKRDLIYYLARWSIGIINVLPRRLTIFVGAWIGLLAWALLPKDRHRIRKHLTMVFKNRLTEREKGIIGRNFFVNSGKNLVEAARFQKHYHSQIKPLVTVEGLEHFDRAYKAGKGLLGVTGHIGNFELMAVHLASLGYDIAVIGREMYDPRLDRMLVENRKALGLTNIYTTDSPRHFLSWLKAGKAIGVLIDTDSFRVRSMLIPAFGRLSNTPVGQTVMGLRVGAAFVPAACVRTPDDRYKIIIRPAIGYEPTGDSEKDIYEVTLRCTQALEEIILEHPDQWIWLHNRWHTRP